MDEGIVRDRSTSRSAAARSAHLLSLSLLTLLAATALIACSRASAASVQVIGPSGSAPSTPGKATAGPPPLLPVPAAPAPKQINPTAAPKVGAASAVVVDDASGAVLLDLDAHRQLQPASLTKIATAALAIDRGKLDETVTVGIDFDAPQLDDASVMGLKQGDRFTLRDLLYGLMLPSGADAAIAIGRTISGSDEAFVKDLNAFMPTIGLRDSHFIDPHGLGGPTHVSSAYDIAMLSRYAMRQTLFANIVKQRTWKAVGSRTIQVYNTNDWEFDYPGGDGVKTGFTEQAGATLSATASRAGHRLFVTVFNSNNRDADTTALMDWAFNTFCWNDGQLGCVPQGANSVASGR